ncbi:hypothetical protein M446_4081 [Methylobacterium sp. 4-46]|uniref:DUF3800 domain-containing protein n=1 Tax=unclassified Methylobacterium TaxID=2615210 RepID=UPI000165C85D|nr:MULTISPECIES: DUF3800 domain-containing protein [Methylobacterium]ACA18439.1 hypothetical protein M446_4081 [Methylobacterium sp. 4-46]WFT77731.1 DUF3800 domain-containing protein [Methylobacterium nodulans]
MDFESPEHSYRYVAFIDEAGDDGLRSVRPIDPDGGTEWFILSAVLIRADCEASPPLWVRHILSQLDFTGQRDLHFNRLRSDRDRETVCKNIADLPARLFIVACNKKNIRQHTNQRAGKIPSRNWFYCWASRLLLERVTAYCGLRNLKEDTPRAKVKFVFSESHRMSYSQFRAYLHWLRLQSIGKSLYLDRGDLDWSVVDIDLVESYPHKTRAGLMLADVVASAFFQSVTPKPDGSCRPEYAKLLKPRMAMRDNSIVDFGLKVMPYPLWTAELTEEQKAIFRFYGYKTEPGRRR